MTKIGNIIKAFSIAILLIMGVASKAQTQAAFRSVSAENKVAIIPITYIGDGNEVKVDEMRYRLQNIAYLYLKKDAMELKFQDPAETNALLLKKGINESNIRKYTPRELAEILHVEYVLIGMVSQESIGMSTMNNSRKVEHYSRRGKKEKEIRGHTRTMEDFSTNIDLSVYNSKGEQIYSRTRCSILSTSDAYRNGLEYLLKRTPLYKK